MLSSVSEVQDFFGFGAGVGVCVVDTKAPDQLTVGDRVKLSVGRYHGSAFNREEVELDVTKIGADTSRRGVSYLRNYEGTLCNGRVRVRGDFRKRAWSGHYGSMEIRSIK